MQQFKRACEVEENGGGVGKAGEREGGGGGGRQSIIGIGGGGEATSLLAEGEL